MTDFRKLFKSTSFAGFSLSQASDISEKAQSILNEALDKATVVYGNGRQMDVVSNPSDSDTHKALLIQVEPLKECSHDKKPMYLNGQFICQDCNKQLIPTGFKVKE